MKPGDTVTIYRKVTKEKGWNNTWVNDMDKEIGKTHTIYHIDVFGILFHGTSYRFPKSSLKYATKKQNE